MRFRVRTACCPPASDMERMVYLARRVLHSMLVLVGVSVLSFIFLDLAPGEFFSDMRLNPQISPETVASLRSQYGLDQPLPVRYGRWVRSVAKGEWGYSFAYNLPVSQLIWVRARNTLALTIVAAALAWSLAIPVGMLAAERRGSRADRIAGAASSTLLAIPDLLIALGLLVLAVRTRLFPVGGMASLDAASFGPLARMKDTVAHFTLPVLALVLATLPVFFRHARAAMAEALASTSVLAARGHGIPRRRILFRYALPAAANPLISLFGLSIATLLSDSLLVEVVMGWPGLGPMLLEAILSRDLYVVIGAVMLSTLFLVAGSLVADALLYWSDPRIRQATT
jgi:peptide/nickel transport system permease protein